VIRKAGTSDGACAAGGGTAGISSAAVSTPTPRAFSSRRSTAQARFAISSRASSTSSSTGPSNGWARVAGR
jgi:hypothetical protein